jgi:hypothetical protein
MSTIDPTWPTPVARPRGTPRAAAAAAAAVPGRAAPAPRPHHLTNATPRLLGLGNQRNFAPVVRPRGRAVPNPRASVAPTEGSPAPKLPGGFPLVGNLVQLGSDVGKHYLAYPKLYHELGSDTISLTSLGAEVINTRCPECAGAILDHASGLFRKPYPAVYGEAGRWLGDGLAFMEDQTAAGEARHKAVRAVVAPALGPRAMNRLAHAFVRGSDGAVQLMRQLCAAGGGAEVEVDLLPVTSAATLDTIGHVAFATTLGQTANLMHMASEADSLGSDGLPLTPPSEDIARMLATLSAILPALLIGGLLPPVLYRMLPQRAAFLSALDEFDAVIARVTRERLAAVGTDG